MNDTERLDWLSRQDGGCLVNDDNGRWAFASDGYQNCSANGKPFDLYTTHFVEKHAWQGSIRKALDHAIKLDSLLND